MLNCPCGSNKGYSACCGAFIVGNAIPKTPEALMRSRYTAYTEANIDYISRTMKSPANDHFDPEEALQWAKRVEWQKLDVIKTSQDGEKGWVEFIAYFYDKGKRHAIHELSEFHQENGVWFYVNGSAPKNIPFNTSPRLNRNDLCHCQSGKKYKKCCGKTL